LDPFRATIVKAPGLHCDRVVVGLFAEEEEGINTASDVVKVQGEDPAAPGYLRGDRATRYVGDG